MTLTHRPSQRDRATAYLAAQGMSRLNDLIAHGVTASTLSRLERDGTVTRLARGLYQLADASLDVNHTLAQASKLVPKGVICLTSALAHPELQLAANPLHWTDDYALKALVWFRCSAHAIQRETLTHFACSQAWSFSAACVIHACGIEHIALGSSSTDKSGRCGDATEPAQRRATHKTTPLCPWHEPGNRNCRYLLAFRSARLRGSA